MPALAKKPPLQELGTYVPQTAAKSQRSWPRKAPRAPRDSYRLVNAGLVWTIAATTPQNLLVKNCPVVFVSSHSNASEWQDLVRGVPTVPFTGGILLGRAANEEEEAVTWLGSVPHHGLELDSTAAECKFAIDRQANPFVLQDGTFCEELTGQDEEDVVEFRCLPTRVESIAELRHKLKLTSTAAEFARSTHDQSFRFEDDLEEQSE